MFAHKPCLLISLRETVVTIKVVIEIGAKLEIHHRYLALRRLHQNYDPPNGGHFERRAAVGWRNTHVTAIRRSITLAVNKFLLAYVIWFKRVNFRQYFVCLRERICSCSARYYLSADAIFGTIPVVT